MNLVVLITEFNGEILIVFDPHDFWKILTLYTGINLPIFEAHVSICLYALLVTLLTTSLCIFSPKAPSPSVSVNDIYNLLDSYLPSTEVLLSPDHPLY